MKLREASPIDAHSIADIHTTSWRNTYQNALSEKYLSDVVPHDRMKIWEGRLNHPKPNQYVIVAEQKEAIGGFTCIYFGENVKWGSYLDNLHVRREYQSKGIGKSLLIAAATWCYKQELTGGMCLLVNQDNINAQRFYQSLGARNAEATVWNAPDGSMVPTYWFVWDQIGVLRDL